MLLTKEEKESRVIDLYSQGKTYRQIAEEVRMSPNDIHTILKKKEEEKNNSIVTNKQQQPSSLLSTRAYELFSNGKTPLQVAIALNIRQSQVTKYYKEYCKLKRLHKFILAYTELGGDDGIGDFLKLHKLSKKEGISRKQVLKLLQLADEDNPSGLSQLEKRRKWLIDEIHELDMQIERSKEHLQSVNDEIASAKALLNSYHLLCERKRKEAENLNNELSRLEALVSHFKIKDEGYSKLKQIVKENVKVLLSENRKLISISFGALVQTLKDNPQTVNLIQNIDGANDGEQHKDNHVSITQYFESNKDRILDICEKNYENLVEELTNNVMNTAANSSNSALPLPQSSSSRFPNLSNENDIYGIEEPESFHNSKGEE